MAGIFQSLFGGKPAGQVPERPSEDTDFADFAGAPDPSPASIASSITNQASTAAALPTGTSPGRPVLYTKWYRVWERTTPQDFYAEVFVIFFLVLLGISHVWGTRKNRRIAKGWFAHYVPVLEAEFAVVGFGGRKTPSVDDVDELGLLKASVSDRLDVPVEPLREKTPQEFVSYATGRQNVAVLDSRIELSKRYNPALWFAEVGMGFFFESMASQSEGFRATMFPFDGKEADIVPVPGGKLGEEVREAKVASGASSSYDGFIWAVVNKDYMKTLRDERYDVSLTSTRDHAKLPVWATVMTESAEVTELLLTSGLINALEKCGDDFEYLIVTDQPVDKPTKLEETTPKKRVSLSVKIRSTSSAASSVDLFTYYIRLPDQLASQAHFRPEVLRKVRQVREDEIKKLQRVGDDEKADQWNSKRDKQKKEKRDAMLKTLSADEQRKYLDKEREKELRKSQKKMTKRA